jgi:hypothetical protein
MKTAEKLDSKKALCIWVLAVPGNLVRFHGAFLLAARAIVNQTGKTGVAAHVAPVGDEIGFLLRRLRLVEKACFYRDLLFSRLCCHEFIAPFLKRLSCLLHFHLTPRYHGS